MTRRLLVLTAVVLIAAVAPATAAASRQGESAYAGSHVTFDAKSTAIVDYSVDGKTAMKSVRVQSQSKSEGGLGLDISADLAAVSNISGSALSVKSSSNTNAMITTESGATLASHDNGHGSLVVTASDESQVVNVGLAGGASAEQSGDSQVVVTNSDGTKQAYVVAGDGAVTTNENGNVSASLEQNSRLVVRSYAGSRTSTDKSQENLIADGTAAANVYLSKNDGKTVTDTVKYGKKTSVDVSEQSSNTVKMAVSRTESQGKVVIVSTSKEAFDAADDVQISVDGEAAVQASSYTELKEAANGGSTSKYMVSQSSSAKASTDVAVALNHFSSRDVTMQSGDGSTSGSGSSNDQSSGNGDDSAVQTSSGSGPGFGAVGAFVALLSVAGIGLLRRE